MNTENKNDIAVKSPLSDLPPKKIRDLPRQFLLEQLERYYGKKPPAEVVETDYSIWQCAETRLEFAWPMLPGNALFYEWVSRFPSYYPGIRWEYGEVRRMLGAGTPGNGKDFKIVDVGCGKGDFLKSLDFLPAGHRFALDLNEPAVQACREQGFQACCGTIETAMAAGFVKAAQFPVVTSFHCLEHVEKPVEFVRSLAGIVAPGGRLFVSTPYSPMSFEADWFDVLNHPPHHMTRWNLRAYQRLAEMLGLKLRYFTPPSSTLKRTVSAFALMQYGPNQRISKAALVRDLLRQFPSFLRLYGKQKERARTNQAGGADLILVELTVS